MLPRFRSDNFGTESKTTAAGTQLLTSQLLRTNLHEVSDTLQPDLNSNVTLIWRAMLLPPVQH